MIADIDFLKSAPDYVILENNHYAFGVKWHVERECIDRAYGVFLYKLVSNGEPIIPNDNVWRMSKMENFTIFLGSEMIYKFEGVWVGFSKKDIENLTSKESFFHLKNEKLEKAKEKERKWEAEKARRIAKQKKSKVNNSVSVSAKKEYIKKNLKSNLKKFGAIFK
jgi:hypothetical protein